jgi:hypothetical protein
MRVLGVLQRCSRVNQATFSKDEVGRPDGIIIGKMEAFIRIGEGGISREGCGHQI